METLHLPPPPPDSSVPSRDQFLSPLYYGFIVVGIAGIVLVIYNFIFVLYCAPRRIRTSPQSLNGSLAITSRRFQNSDNRDLISTTFKYSKEAVASDQEAEDSESTSFHNECVVCMSPYKDGQDVRKLVHCSHSFHAPCIDKWLHSHSDFPLCRSDLMPTSSQCFQHMPEEANPTAELPVSGTTLV